jgi:hypothetical protein
MFDCGLGNAYRSVICLQKNERVSIGFFLLAEKVWRVVIC